MGKERYECKYNEKLMKHYTFDNENKEELGYKCVVRVLNQQNKQIKELEALTRELNFDFAQTKERLQALQDYYTNSIEMLEEERKNILSKLNSDESLSLQTCRSLQRRLSEKTLKIEVFAQFINDLYMLEVEI